MAGPARGGGGSHRQRPLTVIPSYAPVDSQFDPAELVGTVIPFVDPFSFDPADFRTEAPSLPSLLNHSSLQKLELRARLSGTVLATPVPGFPRIQDSEPYHEPSLPQRVFQLAAIALPEVPDVVPERTRLNADQAICIFNQRGTKTSRTAAQLSAEYGVSPKAIRDIWTRKSWAHDTRPHWTSLDLP